MIVNQKSTIYNTMGSVRWIILKFINIEKYEEFEKNDFLGFDEVQADVVIDENNVPEKAWFIKYDGEMVEIEW